MPEENTFEIISRLVNTDDDKSGLYFHVLKIMHKNGMLTEFLKYAQVSHKICPEKSVGEFFWEFCENMDLLHDDTNYAKQQVKLYSEGKVTPFRLHRHRNLRTRTRDTSLLLYLEEYTGMDMSDRGDEIIESYAAY